jgi:hypothetical protein
MAEQGAAGMTARIQAILHRSLVEVRNLASAGLLDQARDLADTVEFLPLLVLRWNEEQARLVRPSLLHYESKYPGSAGRYTAILDAEEDEFQQLYRARSFAWDVPEGVAEPAAG